jgi:hypothetical protein
LYINNPKHVIPKNVLIINNLFVSFININNYY